MFNPPLPSILYKFLGASVSPADGSVPFIDADCLLRYSQPNSFNDPFEALPIWSLDGLNNEIIERFFVGNTPRQEQLPFAKRRDYKARKHASVKRLARENPEKLTDILMEESNRVASEDTGILSLSASWEASPMWAHYASDHEGLCIGFDCLHHYFTHRKDNLVCKIEYAKVRPIVPIESIMEMGMAVALYEFKDDRWQYEEEFRLIKPLRRASLTLGNDKRGYPIKLFRIPAEAVKEVVVGLHASQRLKDRVKSWQAKNQHVVLYQATINKSSYSIDRKPLKL